ncbi:MAG TPA: polysaccharide deacetylase family protein [Ktedonobacterales bacterium]
MNLVAFSVKSKGARNFARRLWTVFSRFGFGEERSRRCLDSIVSAVAAHGAAPTFFIPAVVLDRHPTLLAELTQHGCEVGIHGYVHNDYRGLDADTQCAQVRRAMTLFQRAGVPFSGFRNPYLGWTPESPAVFAALGLTYDSNEAVIHEVLDMAALSEQQRDGLARSLVLFQAIPYGAYTLRPHLEQGIVRIPTSIPDDEMLFDRLRLDAATIGGLWSEVMRRVYSAGGIYVLNLHPERGILCRPALDALLATAAQQERPVWITRLDEVAAWWRERRGFHLVVTPDTAATNDHPGRWRVQAQCAQRATLLARHVRVVEGAKAEPWYGPDTRLTGHQCIVESERCPIVALSVRTADDVAAFLEEHGFPYTRTDPGQAERFALFLDLPDGLGSTREEQIAARSALLRQLLELDAPLVYFGCWPDGARSALSITGDIDSLTIQDFFLRIREVAQQRGYSPAREAQAEETLDTPLPDREPMPLASHNGGSTR